MVVFFKHYILESVELQQSVSVTEICLGILGNFVQVHARKKELKVPLKEFKRRQISDPFCSFVINGKIMLIYTPVCRVYSWSVFIRPLTEKDHVDPIIRILYNKLFNYDLKALSEATHSAKNRSSQWRCSI